MGYSFIRTLLLASVTLPELTTAAFPETSDNHCDCYLTNATSSNYFTTHKFFDFRSLSKYAGVPGPIPDAYQSSKALATSDYFLDEDWTSYWGVQGWNNSVNYEAGDAHVLMVHSPNNIYIETNQDENPASETFLTLRTLRLEDFQSAAEFESISQAYHFVSARMYARTVGSPGAVTAMFTYKDSGDPNELTHVQEADLEIRTMDPPDTIQYTNQPSYTSRGLNEPKATRNVTVPAGLDRNAWAYHRMDWNPDKTTWYINGENVASIDFQTPRDPSMVIFNTWSDGGYWTGNMSVGTEAYMQVQWIELVYNSTGTAKTTDTHKKRDGEFCYNVCSIDDTSKTGTPVLLQGSGSRLLGEKMGILGSACVWMPLVLMILMFW
ncbi:concanavalin A-like lectin/glucanase domain-containing protein [Xylariomycetidae sp. FL2044]|nr:concanavalin A-like lectin/glucanase domain-containing protein [Xylariomycetidae sp. FL2044]